MSDLTMKDSKWGAEELTPVPKQFNAAIRELVAARVAESDRPWSELVTSGTFDLFTAEDAIAVEKSILDTGYRFEFSATASLESEPDKYKRPEGLPHDEVFHNEVVDGRRLVGHGDNVLRKEAPMSGTVALISTIEHVMEHLEGGVPENAIAVIDDSGGTLTAPIMEGFAGIICLGGTVRSHLGILAREYDVPTLMNCTIGDLVDGDRVEIEVTAAPPAADDYETGNTGHARIWKFEGDL